MRFLKIIYILLISFVIISCGEKSVSPDDEKSIPNPVTIDTTLFDSTGTITDIDGNTYITGKIGNQWWMIENLKVTRFRNGDSIPNITNDTLWAKMKTAAYCNLNNNINYVAVYGRLYNWYAVNDNRKIAPEGWHVPSDNEWKQLEIFLGMSQTDADDIGIRGFEVGGKMKAKGTTHWNSPNAGATNSSGFTALPGSGRFYNGDFGQYSHAYFWSTTQFQSRKAYSRLLNYIWGAVSRNFSEKEFGLSVRCIKD